MIISHAETKRQIDPGKLKVPGTSRIVQVDKWTKAGFAFDASASHIGSLLVPHDVSAFRFVNRESATVWKQPVIACIQYWGLWVVLSKCPAS